MEVDQCLISKIGHGLLVLLGVAAISASDRAGSDTGWHDNIFEESSMDSLESSGSWAHLGGVGLGYIVKAI